MTRGSSIGRVLIVILAISFLLRLFFLLFGAEIYYNRDNIHVDGDTYVWAVNIINLIEHGNYTIDFEHEYGHFSRLPGYSFFIGIFYLLCGKNVLLAFTVIGWSQIFIDVFSVFLFFKIGILIFKREGPSLLLAALYGTYPFIIVWTPVVYAETLGIFFMALTLYFFLKEKISYHYIYSGIFLGAAMLVRPQIAVLAPVFCLIIVFQHFHSFNKMLKYLMQLCFMVMVIYGSWPLRNYVNHNKLIFTRDLKSIPYWNTDVRAFWDYIFVLKAEWEPQFSQIVQNKSVDIPKHAYTVPGDSAKLAKVLALCKSCGSGFSRWPGYWKAPVEDGQDCNEEIIQLFSELEDNQREHNFWNVYFWVPMQNLKKALFKSQLYDQATTARKLASLLFYYRTFLIFAGFFGLILMYRCKNGNVLMSLGIFLYVTGWYLYLAFVFHNMEIRYLLPADILLLIPASYVLYILFESIKGKLARGS